MDRLSGAFGAHEAEDHPDDYVEDGQSDLDPPPSPVGQDERRMQVRAYNHWAGLLGEGVYPHIDDLEPHRLDDFGPYSVLLDFSAGVDNPAVRFVGEELRKECDLEGPLQHLEDVPPRSLLSRITDHYMQILANQAPIGFEAEFVNQRGQTVLYRGILLPYSSDDETIDFIFGVINWKELADARTADELLLQIDQALARGEDADTGPDADEALDDMLELTEPVEDLNPEASDGWGEQEDVLELGKGEMVELAAQGELPAPGFAAKLNESEPSGHRRERGVDALGNPLGGLVPAVPEDSEDFGEEDEYDSGIKTAADYGLPDWDEDEFEDSDVEDVVDPLADEDAGSSLMSLVSRGERSKKTVDLSAIMPAVELPAVPRHHEPDAPAPAVPAGNADPAIDAPAGRIHYGEEAAEDAALVAAAAQHAPEGLYDCLAAARELAQAAQNTEDRSRKALYAAVGLAYDFSLEAQAAPDDFQEIIADNGLTMQDRAPMTPIVKLVFGADYDKTRLTEYAAVLTHAHRLGVERGRLVEFLRAAEGGLKGVVQAERRARKEEQGKPVEDDGTGIRSALARKLRKLDTSGLGDIASDGPEFALVMVRRTGDGDLVVVGELAEDRALLEKAARKLLAR